MLVLCLAEINPMFARRRPANMLATSWAASSGCSVLMILVSLLVIRADLSIAQNERTLGRIATSELKFENQNLESIPSAQLCDSAKQDQPINVV